jgi:hypothetical protein
MEGAIVHLLQHMIIFMFRKRCALGTGRALGVSVSYPV